MKIEIPLNIGDKINGEKVRGIHIYVCEDGTIKAIRCHIGNGHFVNQECNIKVNQSDHKGSFDTDDFFYAAVKRSYNNTNTCVCCGKEIPEGWQICCDCARK